MSTGTEGNHRREEDELPFRWKRLTVVLILLAASVAVQASPDLVVAGIVLDPPHPVSGDVVTVLARVANVGEDATDSPFHVTATVDGVRLQSTMVPRDVEVDEEVWIEMEWVASVGVHTLEIAADEPFDRIDETRETNNSEVATILVQLGPEESSLRELRIAVAPFADSSGSGFVNVGEGVATAVASRLEEIGFRIIRPEEVRYMLQERQLDGLSIPGTITAARLLGADLLVAGNVLQFALSQRAFSLGVLSLSSAAAEIGIQADVYGLDDQALLSSAETWQREEGDTGFSIDLGWLLSWLQPEGDICSGGLLTDRQEYSWGQPVRIGFSNSGPGGWLDVEIVSSIGEFVSWRGSQYIATGECGEWEWDQRGFNGESVIPGVYHVRIRRESSILDEVSFVVRADGLSISVSEEITVGTEAFRSTLRGSALSRGLNDLSGGLTETIKRTSESFGQMDRAISSAEARVFAMSAAFAGTEPLQGRVAQILPGGEIAINVGATRGVSIGDVFEVLDVADLITDPATGSVLAFEELDVKGEIIIYDVRDLASYAHFLSPFDIEIGDVVRRVGQ